MARDGKKYSSEAEETPTPKASLGGQPRFVRCHITGPDGKPRPAWEMWLGTHCFGRADRKEMLLRSLARQQQPPQSFHWREVHRRRFARARQQQGAAAGWPVEAEESDTP